MKKATIAVIAAFLLGLVVTYIPMRARLAKEKARFVESEKRAEELQAGNEDWVEGLTLAAKIIGTVRARVAPESGLPPVWPLKQGDALILMLAEYRVWSESHSTYASKMANINH